MDRVQFYIICSMCTLVGIIPIYFITGSIVGMIIIGAISSVFYGLALFEDGQLECYND